MIFLVDYTTHNGELEYLDRFILTNQINMDAAINRCNELAEEENNTQKNHFLHDSYIEQMEIEGLREITQEEAETLNRLISIVIMD
jgi:hypothetical protein